MRRDGAEIGIAFDGDADRIGVVDERRHDHVGRPHSHSLRARRARAHRPGQPIIFDVKCSQALPAAVERAGGQPIMWKTGHSLIKDKMRETHAPIAGEMSGHMFFTEGFYGHDDALYGAARLLRILADAGRSVKQLLADVPDFVSTPEIRIDVPEELKFGLVERAVKHFRARARRDRRRRRARAVRRRLGTHSRVEHAARDRRALRGAQPPSASPRSRAEMEGWLRAQGVRV